jgi:hypothetical protein
MSTTKCGNAILVALLLSVVLCGEVNWTKPDSWNAALPDSIQIFKAEQPFGKSNLRAYYSKVNLSDSYLELNSLSAKPNTAYKTAQFWALMWDYHVYISLNGGYFNPNQSVSLVIHNSEVRYPNVKYTNQNGTDYPLTRSAFGINAEGKMEFCWIYSVDSDEDVWCYDEPSPNVGG